MEVEQPIQWILLGQDIWREIFSWFSFHKIQRLRLVSSTWNRWILEHNSFWPLGIIKQKMTQ